MARNVAIFLIFLIISISFTLLLIVNNLIVHSHIFGLIPHEYTWIPRGIVNILGYATVLIPGYLTYKYVKKTNYFEKSGGGLCKKLLRNCFGEEETIVSVSQTPGNAPGTANQRTFWQETTVLLFHFFGLQVSYLTWGVLQEKVMTQEYRSEDGESAYFNDSQFLVFVNRILAFFISGLYLLYKSTPRQKCPLYKYVYCSVSNIMSSWCQYEALKYVSFPLQVLAKAAKTIPVMVMGKIVSNTKYEFYEYVTSAVLSIGMLFFLFDTDNDKSISKNTTFSGVFLLGLYIAFDSFTSNWQGALFQKYTVKPIQMMCFVNFFSCILTLTSLVQQESFGASLTFMFKYNQFVWDCILLSVCSATGQLFIYSTISNFGPLVFAIISTIRQCLSILLSCLIYKHDVSWLGIMGVCLVFLSVFLRIYCKERFKKIRQTGGRSSSEKLISL